MDLKKKLTLHLDAAIVIAVLFCVSVGISAYLINEVRVLSKQTLDMQMQKIADDLTLSSHQAYIARLEKNCNEPKDKDK